MRNPSVLLQALVSLCASSAVMVDQSRAQPQHGRTSTVSAHEQEGVVILANGRIELQVDLKAGLSITSVRALPNGVNTVKLLDLTFPVDRKGGFEAQRQGQVRDCTYAVRNGNAVLTGMVERQRYTVRETIVVGNDEPWATVTCALDILEPPVGHIVCPILFLNDAHRMTGMLHDEKVENGFETKTTPFLDAVRVRDCGHLMAPVDAGGRPLLALLLPTLAGYEPDDTLYEGLAYSGALYVRRRLQVPAAGDVITWTYHVLAPRHDGAQGEILQSLRELVPGARYGTRSEVPFSLETGNVVPYTDIVARPGERGLTLARDGKPLFSIVVPGDANTAEQLVAAELAADLGTIIGVKPAVTPETASTEGVSICLGRTRAGLELRGRLLAHESSDGAFCVQVTEEMVCAVGRTDVATSYAADRLLEMLGVRRFHEDPLGIVMPSCPDLTVKPVEVVDRPKMAFRAFGRRYGGNAVYCPSTYPRRMAERLEQAKWSGHLFYCQGHSETRFMPAAELFEEHPEYYALLGGDRADKRKQGVRAHLCTTNPEVPAHFAQRVAACHRTYPFLRLFLLFSDDYGFGYCDCLTCRTLYGPGTVSYGQPSFGRHSDLWHGFVADVAAQLKGLAPEVAMGSGAYQTYQLPPVTRQFPHGNAVYLAVMQSEDVGRAINDPNATANVWRHRVLKEWQQLACLRVCYMYYNKIIWFDLPNPTYRKAAHDWRYYRTIGIQGCTSQWSRSHKFIYPAVRKLLWNPDYDVDLLLDDYCATMYGAAGPVVRNYYDRLEQAFLGREVILSAGAYALGVFTPELMSDCRRLVDRATATPVDSACSKRLAVLADSFAYYERVIAVLSAVRELQANTIPDRAEALAAAAETALEALDAHYRERPAKGVPLSDSTHRAVLNAYTPVVRSALKNASITGGRELIPVPKQWKFRLDPDAVGLLRNWQMGGHDDTDWQGIPIGISWEEALGRPYDGVAWYRVSISVPERLRGTPVRLYFGGVDGRTTVYLNGELLGENTEWDKDFEFDISAQLRYGRNNVIAVRVHDLANAGGIYRPVLIH